MTKAEREEHRELLKKLGGSEGWIAKLLNELDECKAVIALLVNNGVAICEQANGIESCEAHRIAWEAASARAAKLLEGEQS